MFSAMIANAAVRIAGAVETKVRIFVPGLEQGRKPTPPFRAVPHPRSKYPPEGAARMKSSKTDGEKKNGERTNVVSKRNHPAVHRRLERHVWEYLRGSNGKGTRREISQGSPAGHAPEFRGQSGANGQRGKVSIPRRRVRIVSDIARSCLHIAAAGGRESSAHGFPSGIARSQSCSSSYRRR